MTPNPNKGIAYLRGSESRSHLVMGRRPQSHARSTERAPRVFLKTTLASGLSYTFPRSNVASVRIWLSPLTLYPMRFNPYLFGYHPS